MHIVPALSGAALLTALAIAATGDGLPRQMPEASLGSGEPRQQAGQAATVVDKQPGDRSGYGQAGKKQALPVPTTTPPTPERTR
jgi:hypothetical protein